MAPEEVPGEASGSKAKPKGGKKASLDFFWAPLGGGPGLPKSLTDNDGSPMGRRWVADGSPREPGTGAEGPWGDKGG